MERPQLTLELRFNRAYQQRERRAYRCWAPVTSGEEHFPNPRCEKNLPLESDYLDTSLFEFPLLKCHSLEVPQRRAAGN